MPKRYNKIPTTLKISWLLVAKQREGICKKTRGVQAHWININVSFVVCGKKQQRNRVTWVEPGFLAANKAKLLAKARLIIIAVCFNHDYRARFEQLSRINRKFFFNSFRNENSAPLCCENSLPLICATKSNLEYEWQVSSLKIHAGDSGPNPVSLLERLKASAIIIYDQSEGATCTGGGGNVAAKENACYGASMRANCCLSFYTRFKKTLTCQL